MIIKDQPSRSNTDIHGEQMYVQMDGCMHKAQERILKLSRNNSNSLRDRSVLVCNHDCGTKNESKMRKKKIGKKLNTGVQQCFLFCCCCC